MRKLKLKRRVKGMTLIECIIAILVLGIMGTIMARIGQVVTGVMMETNHVNNKVVAESPYGAVRDVDGINNLVNDLTAASEAADNGETDVTIAVGTYGTVNAKRYSTSAAATDAQVNQNIITNTNMDADLRFYVIN